MEANLITNQIQYEIDLTYPSPTKDTIADQHSVIKLELNDSD